MADPNISDLDRTFDATSTSTSADEPRPWARLVPVVAGGDSTGENMGLLAIELEENHGPLFIGRSPECDVRCRFADKRISARHCRIYTEEDDSGEVVPFVDDLSSNGTFVNGVKVGKGNRRRLFSGDEIGLTNLVVKHGLGQGRVSYLFLVTPPRQDPQVGGQQQTAAEEEEATQEEKEEQEDVAVGGKERREAEEVLAGSSVSVAPLASDARASSREEDLSPREASVSHKRKKMDDDDDDNDAAGGDGKTKKKEKEDPPGDAMEASPGGGGAQRVDDELERDKKKLRKLEETYEDNMVCGICQELFYKCVALFPCMHNFCACCYSEWRERGNHQCPQCRAHVQGLSKNHTICAIIESYLDANPEKARDPEELRAMDARSKLTDEMLRQVITYNSKGQLKLKNKSRRSSSFHDGGGSGDDEEDDDDDEDEEDDDDDDEDNDGEYRPRPTSFLHRPIPMSLFGALGGGGGSLFGTPYRTLCRQCGSPGPDGFQCPTDGSAPHHLCSACGQPFPDRGDRCPAPVKCELCNGLFCDLYWGCASPAGVGKFKKLSQHVFTGLPPASFNNNVAEQEIMVNYLRAKGLTVTDLWLACLADADAGTLTFNGVRTHKTVQSGQYACSSCAQYVFENLVYLYRANLAPEHFPASVTSRPDCHWGRNCRTQQHNLGHAKRFNHICEQTRF